MQPLFAVAEEVKPILQKDISLIKDMLQKFKDDRTFTAAQPEAATSSPLPTVQPAAPVAVADAIVDNNIPVHLEAKKPEPAIFSNAAVMPAVEQNISQQALPQQNNIPVAAAPAAAQAAVPAIEAQTNPGGNFSGNTGQGSNPQAQIAVNAQGASSTQATASNNDARFSSFLNRTTQTPVVEQVAFQVKTALGSGNSKITIQLHPEDLGKLDITLDVDSKGKTGVTITTDNKHTLDLLQRDSQGLQKALADAGLKADTGSLSFNLRGGQQEGQGQNQSQAASQYRKSQPDEPQPENLNIASVTRSYVINLPDGLDIKI
jgi:flagellar hook-length control protein FliK